MFHASRDDDSRVAVKDEATAEKQLLRHSAVASINEIECQFSATSTRAAARGIQLIVAAFLKSREYRGRAGSSAASTRLNVIIQLRGIA